MCRPYETSYFQMLGTNNDDGHPKNLLELLIVNVCLVGDHPPLHKRTWLMTDSVVIKIIFRLQNSSTVTQKSIHRLSITFEWIQIRMYSRWCLLYMNCDQRSVVEHKRFNRRNIKICCEVGALMCYPWSGSRIEESRQSVDIRRGVMNGCARRASGLWESLKWSNWRWIAKEDIMMSIRFLKVDEQIYTVD